MLNGFKNKDLTRTTKNRGDRWDGIQSLGVESEEGGGQLKEARDNGDIVRCLVARCCATKVVFGHVVPRNCADADDFVVGIYSADVVWTGHLTHIIKSDPENALSGFL